MDQESQNADPDLITLRARVIRHYAKNGIKTEHDLRRVSAAIAGTRWLEKNVCKNHAAPWDLLKASFFEEADEILGVGPRGGYKTQTIGLLNAIEALMKPGIQIVHAAASLGQAKRAHEWTTRYLTKDAVRLSGFVQDAKFYKTEIKLKNGSRIEVLPATTTGLNAPHSHKVRLDEFELIKPEVLDEARLIPTTRDGYKRGLLYISSRKQRNGNVDRLLYDRKYRDVKKFIWCIAETVENCTEDRRGKESEIYEGLEDIYDQDSATIEVKAFKKCHECALLPDCRGQFAKSSGWMSIDDTIQIFGSVTREAWLAQMRSRRVMEPTGRVFKFTRARNVIKAGDPRLNPIPGIPIHLTVDFGGGRASTAVLFWQEVEGEIRVLAEYVKSGTGPEEDVPAVEIILARHFPGFKIASRNTGDSAVPIMLNQWNRLTKVFQLEPVRKLKTKTEMVAVLSSLISPANGVTRYYVHPRCETHIEEISNFRHQYRVIRGIRHPVFPDRNVDTVDTATYLALDVDSPARPMPGITVLDVKTGRVESSEEPARQADARKKELEHYIGIKLWRLLNRNRD